MSPNRRPSVRLRRPMDRMEVARGAAVFLDRDGTINEHVGYCNDPAQIRVNPGAAEAIARFNELGFLVIMVTNQSAISRGLATVAQVERCNSEACLQVAKLAGGQIDGIYYAGYHPDFPGYGFDHQADWRKPLPGMFHAAELEFAIDLSRSWLIGDGGIDHDAAKAANAVLRTIILPSAYHQNDVGADFYADTLWDAAQILIETVMLEALGTRKPVHRDHS